MIYSLAFEMMLDEKAPYGVIRTIGYPMVIYAL